MSDRKSKSKSADPVKDTVKDTVVVGGLYLGSTVTKIQHETKEMAGGTRIKKRMIITFDNGMIRMEDEIIDSVEYSAIIEGDTFPDAILEEIPRPNLRISAASPPKSPSKKKKRRPIKEKEEPKKEKGHQSKPLSSLSKSKSSPLSSPLSPSPSSLSKEERRKVKDSKKKDPSKPKKERRKEKEKDQAKRLEENSDYVVSLKEPSPT
jgi:hypothetical protein